MASPTVVLLLVPWSNRCPIDWMDKLYTSAQYKPLLHLSSSSSATNNCKSSPRGQSQEIRQYLEGANQSEESIVSFFLDDYATSFESCCSGRESRHKIIALLYMPRHTTSSVPPMSRLPIQTNRYCCCLLSAEWDMQIRFISLSLKRLCLSHYSNGAGPLCDYIEQGTSCLRIDWLADWLTDCGWTDKLNDLDVGRHIARICHQGKINGTTDRSTLNFSLLHKHWWYGIPSTFAVRA